MPCSSFVSSVDLTSVLHQSILVPFVPVFRKREAPQFSNKVILSVEDKYCVVHVRIQRISFLKYFSIHTNILIQHPMIMVCCPGTLGDFSGRGYTI